ncbi:GNAT family N-acetyltransferase, partial [Streptomyces sp. tea 10]|nr:GNAT family N-acetyltransferase [Streptomyces sp. tea 10]
MLLHHTTGRRGFTAHGSDSLRTAARVLGETGGCTAFTSSVGGTVVSALLPYDSPTTWVFAPSGMDFALRKLRPNQPLIVQALLDAAAQGQPVADLFGVASANDPTHPWTGCSAFKRCFGGAAGTVSGGRAARALSAPGPAGSTRGCRNRSSGTR